MNLKTLFELQKQLDLNIEKNHNLTGKPLLSKKLLAFQVEIGELANETRCFKFWSNKKSSAREVILEELVDCLHFILSVGLEKGFENVTVELREIDADLTEQFLNLYIDTNDFVICSSASNYITIFEDLLSLALSLGFSEEEIFEGYKAKNDINHERQLVGY